MTRAIDVFDRRRILSLGASAALGSVLPKGAQAAPYPSGPISVIIPLPPGSVLEMLARGCSERFRKDLNYPFVIDNVPGATSNLGAARAAHSKPDGQTVLLTVSSTISTNLFMFKNMPFDPDKDLSPICLTASSQIALVVNSAFPARSVAEYIAYARAHPGQVAFGSSGIGSPHHLCGEYLASLTDIKLTHVPYKGTPESAMDVIAGHIPSAFTNLGLVDQQAKAGRVRVLAITDDRRSHFAPDVPTIGETVPSFVHAPGPWSAMFVPSGTPPEMATILNHEMNVALRDPGLVKMLAAVYLNPVGGKPEDVTRRVQYERAITRTLAAKIGLKPT